MRTHVEWMWKQLNKEIHAVWKANGIIEDVTVVIVLHEPKRTVNSSLDNTFLSWQHLRPSLDSKVS